MTAADLVVSDARAFMGRYVVEALEREPNLVARMAERDARIFVLVPPSLDESNADAAIERAIAATHVGATERPIFIVQIELYYLKSRLFRGERKPLDVRVERGLFLGVIGLGEGGAMFLDPTFEHTGSVAAVERLRVFVG